MTTGKNKRRSPNEHAAREVHCLNDTGFGGGDPVLARLASDAHSLTPIACAAELTISSREIAELLNSRHDKVKQSIERLAARKLIGVPPLGEYLDSLGRRAYEYRVGKRDSYLIVAQLSPEFTARVVDRWQQLEHQAGSRSRAFWVPETLPDALRLAADLAERNARLTQTVQAQASDVAALRRITASEGSVFVTDAAKALKIGPRRLAAWLDANSWTYRRAGGPQIAHQAVIYRGLLEHAETSIELKDGTLKLVTRVRVTAKGMAELARKFAAAAAYTSDSWVPAVTDVTNAKPIPKKTEVVA